MPKTFKPIRIDDLAICGCTNVVAKWCANIHTLLKRHDVKRRVSYTTVRRQYRSVERPGQLAFDCYLTRLPCLLL